MTSRLPQPEDFSGVDLSIAPAPASQKAVNILILLHGLGDTKESFKLLGSQMALPETACISVQAPNPVPFNVGGAHWGDDLIFDSGTGDLDLDTGFKAATDLLANRVLRRLINVCHYKPRNILMYGFGQGGMAALTAAATLPVSEELGGIISVGGALPAECAYPIAKTKTPVLAIGGSRDSQLSNTAVERIERVFEFVEYKKWSRAGDAMPQSREEMLPIMEFLSRRLQSRQGVPEGSVELGQVGRVGH